VKVVILAGGRGTRLAEETDIRPKPMVEIGGLPILWHIMKIYRAHGLREFVVALGYKGELVKQYFLDYRLRASDVTVSLADGGVDVHDGDREDWIVHLVDTGLDPQSGGRLHRLRARLSTETFLMTYGDGVADIDVSKLLEFHHGHGRLATVTAVRPPARFGGLAFEGDLVSEFIEKPQIGEGWINGGFFVFEPGALEYVDRDDTVLELEPLERLAADGQLVAYRHEGFWQCMDTVRDLRLLEGLWQSGDVPWKVWA
jgi:glucose-1-phosphate cytidylyltransferase